MQQEFDDKGAQTKTYVRFLGYEDERAVESRDIKKLDIPQGSYGFYFYDMTSVVVDRETLDGEEKNTSKTYIIGEKVMTLVDVMRDLPNSKVLQDNMQTHHFDVAQTSSGNLHPVYAGDTIVINSAREQIYPAKGAAPSAKASPRI